MKVFAALLLVLASSTTFAAVKEQACYKAANPSEIKAENIDTGAKSVGKRAMLKLSTETDQYSSTGQAKLGKLRVVTTDESRIMVWSLINPGLKTKVPTYSVECDGGSMTVKKIDSETLLLNSDYIAGEVTNAAEGCNNARLEFKDLVVKKTECKASSGL
jgi:hypothetical protein